MPLDSSSMLCGCSLMHAATASCSIWTADHIPFWYPVTGVKFTLGREGICLKGTYYWGHIIRGLWYMYIICFLILCNHLLSTTPTSTPTIPSPLTPPPHPPPPPPPHTHTHTLMQFCYQFAVCCVILIQMTLLCRILLASTNKIGHGTTNLLGSGQGNMPCSWQSLVPL